MAKNKVKFQAGYSLFEFIQDYGTEEQCHQALYKCRWPTGFLFGGVRSFIYGLAC